jgi:rhamnulokinase
LGNPYHYRDSRTDGIMEKAFAIVPREEIFAATGLQFMQFNTLFQLVAMRLAGSPLLDVAESFLMMPDVFHWLLTGEKVNEMTNATTTQFYDPQKQAWATSLLGRFGLPTKILGKLTAPGTKLGALRADVAKDTGLAGASVVLPGTHDTASAVMAVPAGSTGRASGTPAASTGRASGTHRGNRTGRPSGRPDWCYISSGTWSLMGVEVGRPVINDACRQLNFTNEGGVGGTTRLLKNIAGLWLVQECRRVWNQAGKNYSWDDLTRLADQAAPLAAIINPDDASFLSPASMPEAIREFCRRSNQNPPDSDGAIVRCALEGLALKYRQVLGWLEQLIGGRIETIHIVGGGVQNRQLCQMAADACNRVVVAGPVEATAIGNVMMQAVAAGDVATIAQAREVIRRSFDVTTYEPRHASAWDEAYGRFLALND